MNHTITLSNLNKTISAESGQTLLSVFQSNAVPIRTMCGGKGLCGLCKVKPLTALGPLTEAEEKRLKPEDRAAGIRLSCQIAVDRDMTVDVLGNTQAAQKFRGKVKRKTLLTYDIAGVAIELLEPLVMNFTPGQYLQLDSQEYNGKPAVSRSYSIASPVYDKHIIEIMVRKLPNGTCSGWVFDCLNEGDTVALSGPFGEFGLSQTAAPMIFIAGGSGLSPFWGMLRSMVRKPASRPITFFFGARTQKDLFLVNELHELQKTLPQFSFVPALSDEPADSGWIGERGLITDVVARHFPDTSMHEAYLCGAPGMIDASIKVLTKGGMPDKNIFFDKFA